MWGYKRAASAILTLEEPIESFLQPDGTLRKIPNIGPSSTRVILEVLQTGSSPTIERAISESGQATDIERRRDLRGHFLSRAQVLAALRNPTLTGPRLEDYHGDLQMHSTWSDGVESIADLAEGAEVLGWSRIGVTDHSYGLPIARGMSMEAARQQHREIDELNDRFAGRVRIYKGVEANILADGALDLQDAERAVFEYVIASPHSALRKDTDQTPRMLAAVSLRGVAILGHPQGRMYNSRPGVTADWRAVFREAAAHDVAIEIDGNWHRQDVDYELAEIALEEGCLFALDSDAHSIAEYPFTDYAIAQARVAGVPADRVVNCWDETRFDAWLETRRKARAR
jgi:histidinol phosphatase-like PHP family hydrolase